MQLAVAHARNPNLVAQPNSMPPLAQNQDQFTPQQAYNQSPNVNVPQLMEQRPLSKDRRHLATPGSSNSQEKSGLVVQNHNVPMVLNEKTTNVMEHEDDKG